MHPTNSTLAATLRAASLSLLLHLASSSIALAVPASFWANPRPTGAELGGVAFESATVGYAVGGFGATLRTTDGGISWADLTDLASIGPDFDDVLVLSPGVLLAAGSTPGLHRSTDAGATWSPVANPANGRLRNLFALDASTIFSVGDAGRVIRSTNGGTSWSLLTAPAAAMLVDQWWKDALTGYVVGQNCIRRTTNGGTSWATIPGVPEFNTFFPGDVQFLDAQNGWIFIDFDTYRTTDGGTTWVDLPGTIGQFPIYQEEALIVDAQTRFIATEAEGAEIWKTTNDGSTWTRLLSHLGTRGVTDLHRLPSGAIVASTTTGDLLRSTNEGATWTNSTEVAGPEERMDLTVIDVHSSGLGFCGGWAPFWLQTTDSGRTWFDAPAGPGLSNVFAISIRDPQFVLAGGTGTTSHSDVRRTTDGGATWTTHPLSASFVGYPQGLVAFGDGTCFCATYGGTTINFVYRSTDHGATWHLRNNGVSANVRLFDLFFLDSQHGFVCGGNFSDPTIYRTTDGGGQWTQVGATALLGGSVRDMVWLDGNVGMVVSTSGVFRTTNAGANWVKVSNDGEDAIDFLNATVGVANAFPNNATVTTDGGLTWTPQLLPLPGFIADVAATDYGFLAIGGANAILGFDMDAAPTDIPEVAAAAASSPAFTVWPNPVRVGGTNELRFRIEGVRGADDASKGPIEARLYDVGGRLLTRTPVGAGASFGSVPLEGVELTPGVVFLELRDGAGRKSAKIAVVR